jgi:protein tyrosine phosphatase
MTTKRYHLESLQDSPGAELSIRRFSLKNLESDETREINHYQYLAWPDHGLPVSTTAFLDLTEMAEAANVNNKPMIVHCSAGVGRSGTFCAVHSMVKKLRRDINRDESKEPLTINLIDLILHMRSQRPGMVQTKV